MTAGKFCTTYRSFGFRDKKSHHRKLREKLREFSPYEIVDIPGIPSFSFFLEVPLLHDHWATTRLAIRNARPEVS